MKKIICLLILSNIFQRPVLAQNDIQQFSIPQLRSYHQTKGVDGEDSMDASSKKDKAVMYADKKFDELINNHEQRYSNRIQFEGEALEKHNCVIEQGCPIQLYYDNGNLKVETYLKDRKIDGIYKEYYPNGQLKCEIYRRDGIKNGMFQGYTENGVLITEKNYKAGILDGLYKAFYENGSLKLAGEFIEGKLSGETKVYYDDGATLMRVDHYRDGKVDGLSQVFYKNGKIKAEYQFQQGKKDGSGKEFDEEGHLQSQDTHKSGQPIAER